jgi:hypothetical protein
MNTTRQHKKTKSRNDERFAGLVAFGAAGDTIFVWLFNGNYVG